MALNRTREEMRDGVREDANIKGTSALARHPDATLNDYINRALGSLHRLLTAAMPDQRILASTTITTEDGVSSYALPAGFDFLISIETTINGGRRWLQAYEMAERGAYVDPSIPTNGEPLVYRLRGSNIEFLPVPNGEYDFLIWYVPAATQLAADATAYDTIDRLDEYVISYASSLVAKKDRNWDSYKACRDAMKELVPEIEALGRNRDRASPPRIVDTRPRDPWGRGATRSRR